MSNFTTTIATSTSTCARIFAKEITYIAGAKYFTNLRQHENIGEAVTPFPFADTLLCNVQHLGKLRL
ncbi:MAG: hypothetical protein FWE16_00495 [Firmicutes bacterium]|nr:hypothetical protein [Bacillota bacterium]